MILSQLTETFGQDDQTWLGSAHGTDSCRTVTLDLSKFTAATHYPSSYIKSGVALGKVTSGGLYGPYDDAASDGRQTLVGFLFTPVRVALGLNAVDTSIRVTAALLDHGKVVVANLPIASNATGGGFIDAAGQADVAQRIQFL